MLGLLLITHSSAVAQNYVDYHTSINEAREKVYQGTYQVALQIYQDVFKQFEFRFARDCVNAAELAAYLERDETTAYFVAAALQGGIPLSFFLSQERFKKFRRSSFWSDITAAANGWFAAYENSLDLKLRQEINQMFQADQRIRKSYYRWYNLLWRSAIGRKWKKLNARQVERLVEITKTKGFPGEQLIGIDYPAHHPKIPAQSFSAGMPIAILLHHYSQAKPSHDELWLEQVATGYLHNQHFATICDFQAKYGKGKYHAMGYYGISFTPDTHTPTLDSKRAEIGLASTELMETLRLPNQVLTRFWNYLY